VRGGRPGPLGSRCKRTAILAGGISALAAGRPAVEGQSPNGGTAPVRDPRAADECRIDIQVIVPARLPSKEQNAAAAHSRSWRVEGCYLEFCNWLANHTSAGYRRDRNSITLQCGIYPVVAPMTFRFSCLSIGHKACIRTRSHWQRCYF
jgi:hypothetical protein